MAALPTAVLFAWVVGVFVLFRRLSPRRAVLVAFLVGWFFLPEMRNPPNNPAAPKVIELPLFKVTKVNVLGAGLLLASLCCDLRRWLAFRPRWFDLPMLVWCLCPFASSLTNLAPPDPNGSTPFQDGFAQTREQFWAWGVPYLLGRLYFTDLAAFRELAIGMVLACVAYVPLCLVEMALSPQLHHWVYGFEQHDFNQSVREGGYRPIVFLEHGLAVALWMNAGAVLAFALWSTGAWTRQPLGRGQPPVRVVWLVACLLACAVLLKSKGALTLCVLGAVGFCLTRWLRLRTVMVVLLLLAPLYIGGRLLSARQVSGWLDTDFYDEAEVESAETKALLKPVVGWAVVTGRELVNRLGEVFSPDRAQSFEFRLVNEDKLMEQALRKPLFGWGGWGRARIYDEEGKDVTVTDGLWIITLGDRGFVGLLSLYAAMLLPVVRFLWRHPPAVWSSPAFAPPAAAAVIVVLYMIDNVSNAMFNPLFVLAAGGLAAVCGATALAPRRPEPASRPLAVRPRRPAQPRGLLERPLPFAR